MLYRQLTPQVEFKNFLPTEPAAADMGATLYWLTEVLPPDSRVRASLRKVGLQYLCCVDVVSSIGCFRGEGLAALPQESVDRAVEAIKSSARSWRQVHLGLDGESFVELMTH